MSNQIIQSTSTEPIFKALIKEKVDPEMAQKATEAIRNLAGENVHIEMSARFNVQDAIIKNFQTEMEARFDVQDAIIKNFHTEMEARFDVQDSTIKGLRTDMEARFNVQDAAIKNLNSAMEFQYKSLNSQYRLLIWIIGTSAAMILGLDILNRYFPAG